MNRKKNPSCSSWIPFFFGRITKRFQKKNMFCVLYQNIDFFSDNNWDFFSSTDVPNTFSFFYMKDGWTTFLCHFLIIDIWKWCLFKRSKTRQVLYAVRDDRTTRASVYTVGYLISVMKFESDFFFTRLCNQSLEAYLNNWGCIFYFGKNEIELIRKKYSE